MTVMTAFLRRDALNWLTYRMTVFWHFGSTAATVLGMYLVWATIQGAGADLVAGYNNNYIEYLLTSMVFLEVWGTAYIIPHALRESQQVGTLEALLLGRTPLLQVLVYSGSFPTLIKLTRTLALGLLGYWGMSLWREADAAALFASVAGGFVCFVFIALLFTTSVLVFKQFEPLIAGYSLVNAALAGVMFPLTVLPDWAQLLAQFLPMTHALQGVRLALTGASLEAVFPHLAALTAATLLLAPVSLMALSWGLRRAKTEGTLVQY